MRDRKQTVATVAPMSIFPLDVEDVADLMLGFIDLHMKLNIDLLAEQFEQRGVDVEFAFGEEANDRPLTAKRQVGNIEHIVSVSPSLREQLLVELMRPEEAVAPVKAVLDAAVNERLP